MTRYRNTFGREQGDRAITVQGEDPPHLPHEIRAVTPLLDNELMGEIGFVVNKPDLQGFPQRREERLGSRNLDRKDKGFALKIFSSRSFFRLQSSRTGIS